MSFQIYDTARDVYYAKGVDVSWYQRGMPWDVVMGIGASFAMIRLSDGLTPDSTFRHHWMEAGQRNLLRGVYHLLRPHLDRQAEKVGDLLENYRPESGFWVDIEIAGLDEPRCGRFIEAIEQRLGYRVGIYSRPRILTRLGPLSWSDRKLWIASPHRSWPVLPAQWLEWEFWQYGQAPWGNRHRIDLNLYHGTVEELQSAYGPGG